MTQPRFDGETFNPVLDTKRIAGQLERVRAVCLDGAWRTLEEISVQTKAPQASVSARLRDLRKKRFGELFVDYRRNDRGLFEYQVLPEPPIQKPKSQCEGIDDLHWQTMEQYGKCSMCGEEETLPQEPAPSRRPPPAKQDRRRRAQTMEDPSHLRPRAVLEARPGLRVGAGMRVTGGGGGHGGGAPMFSTTRSDGSCGSPFHRQSIEAYGTCAACDGVATASSVAWKDMTEYARGERPVPRHWEAKCGGLRVAVHRHAFSDPGSWVLTCMELNIQMRLLQATDTKLAQAEAVTYLRALLAGYLRGLR